MRELNEARSEADKIIAQIKKRLADLPSPSAGFKRFENRMRSADRVADG